MRKPKDFEYVRCPDARSDRIHKPEKVFDNGGQGILGAHGHGLGTRDCPYTGLPTVIRPKYKKVNEPKPKVDEPKPMVFWDDTDWGEYFYRWYAWGI
jgi:hypothetical protein